MLLEVVPNYNQKVKLRSRKKMLDTAEIIAVQSAL